MFDVCGCFFGVPTWKGVIPMIVWFFWIVRKCDDDCVVSNNFTTAIILPPLGDHLESSWLHSTTQWDDMGIYSVYPPTQDSSLK